MTTTTTNDIRIAELTSELHDLICDTTTGLTSRFHTICAEIFDLLGGENKLRELKKVALRTRKVDTLEEMDARFELLKQIDELERYKNWRQ